MAAADERFGLRGGKAGEHRKADRRRQLLRGVEQAGGEADDGDASYHLTLTATEVFPTGVIRVIYSPTAAPGGSPRPHRRRSTRNTG